MTGINIPDFRNEPDLKKQINILYQVLVEMNTALQRIQIEENHPNEIRMFIKTKEKLLPGGFKECNGMNGTTKTTSINDMIITQKL